MTTLKHDIKIPADSTVIMCDDSDDDFLLASLMQKRSKHRGAFLHMRSADILLAYLAEEFGAGRPLPALVLMDLNMPGTNGIEATAALRASEEFARMPVVAMLTSSPDPRDRVLAKEAGVDGFLSKPIEATGYREIFDSLVAD